MTTLKNILNILIAAVALTVCALCVSFVVRSLSHTSTPVPVPAPSIPMINTPGRTFPSVHGHYPAPAKAILALAKYAQTQLGDGTLFPGDSPNTSRLLADTRTVITDVQHDPVARRVKDGYLEQALVFVGGSPPVIPSVCPRCALLLDDAL